MRGKLLRQFAAEHTGGPDDKNFRGRFVQKSEALVATESGGVQTDKSQSNAAKMRRPPF
jgi:hypothetical protein